MSSFSYRKGESVKMAGDAGSVDQVYAFKRNLDGSALFPKAELQGPRADKSGKQVFDLTLSLPADEP
jgi:Tfp pilus assembly protein PilN